MDWNPERFHDASEERVKALVDAKREGQEIVSEAGPPEATNVIDLMDALQRSVEQARSSRAEGKEEQPAGQLHRLPTHRDKPDRGKKQGKKAGGRRSKENLENLTKTELYERASKADIPGRSKMNRDQLIKALQKESAAA
ncbi:Rho termination factor N-terminal domain-containing protein [Streptomyces sp. CB03234]|uniref:Rho termination factor N-terminal domain-containing protein n=1 Tax=Streptomyces sp. (strain CB03234) TaxID=1703937 RepID=UPI000939E91F|nr:Rho termination factor N-terminal domain-containing protein [Streptomyces sp. CB03234]